MNGRNTLLLLAVAAGLGAYVYFVEIVGTREREEEEAAQRKVLSIVPDQVTALAVPLDAGGSARLVRDLDGDPDRLEWRLEEPLRYPADSTTVGGILSALETLESKATIDEPPADLDPFGLGETRGEVRVWSGEGEPAVLYLGGESPLTNERYVAVAGDAEHVYAVDGGALASLAPALTRLRDKRVVRLEPDDVEGFALSEYGTMIVRALRDPATDPNTAPDDGSWTLEHPPGLAGDAGRIRRVLQNLAFARAAEFVDEPGALSLYGLDRPEIELEFTTGSGAGTSTSRLALGKGGETIYARVDDAGPVFAVRERMLTDVPRGVFAYRFKQVVRVDGDAVHELEVSFPRDDRTYTFTRDDTTWSPRDESLEVASLKIDDIVFGLRDLQATGVEERSIPLDELGLEPALVRVSARDAQGSEFAWLELGDPDGDRGLAARSSQGETLWRVSNDLGRDVPLGLEAFENTWLEKEPAAEAPAPPAPDPNAP